MIHTPIQRLLLKLSPPVMLALLIQSVYNIVDSFFVARYSGEGLTVRHRDLRFGSGTVSFSVVCCFGGFSVG